MTQDDVGFPSPPTDTSATEAARLLRGLRERIEKLETSDQQADEVGVLRTLTDTGVSSDTVSVSTDSSPTFVWDSDDWDHTEWE